MAAVLRLQRCLLVAVVVQVLCSVSAIAAAVSDQGAHPLQAGILPGQGLFDIPPPLNDARIEKYPTERLCSKPNVHLITEKDMGTALTLGTSFMLQSQKASGHFSYEYNWKLGLDPTAGGEVSSVREAGAAWGLALIGLDHEKTHGSTPPELAAALRKTLDFFEKHSTSTAKGLRMVAYPGQEDQLGSTGTLAILTLAHIDYLRTKAPDEKERSHRMKFLKGLLLSLQASVMEKGTEKPGLIRKAYSVKDGTFQGDHSPYFDGEALLALTKAAKYLGFSELWPTVHKMADAGWRLNVRKGLQQQRDTAVMKGYYQWASMSWHELVTSEHADQYKDFKHRLVDYGLWMVEVHGINRRSMNTGYAFEGLIPAYLTAKKTGLKDAQAIIGCAIDEGMRKISAMQLGHPLAMGLASTAPANARTNGGVQNSLTEAGLRIDTTQHQMHAVIMMKRLLAGQDII